MSSDKFASIDSRAGFEAAVRETLALAGQADAKEIVLIDPTFDDWPLDESGVIDTLRGWAAASRRLVVMAPAFEPLARRAPRFAEWRRQWSHVVQCRSNDELEAQQWPTLLLVSGVACLRLHDRNRFRGIASQRPLDLAEGQERFDALVQRSVDAYPATTLGL